MINILCKADILDYGTSPRYGWLTYEKGKLLGDYLENKTADELYDLVMSTTEDTPMCGSNYCNCDNRVDGEGCKNNPLFR
jgi:hypothetical protein